MSQVIDRIMREVDNLKKVSDEFARRDEGGLVIACTHTQARYLLPRVIPAFRKQFPKVHLSLAEGSRRSWPRWCCTSRPIWHWPPNRWR